MAGARSRGEAVAARQTSKPDAVDRSADAGPGRGGSQVDAGEHHGAAAVLRDALRPHRAASTSSAPAPTPASCLRRSCRNALLHGAVALAPSPTSCEPPGADPYARDGSSPLCSRTGGRRQSTRAIPAVNAGAGVAVLPIRDITIAQFSP